MQAIVTKYLGPTDTRGSRIVARSQSHKITVPYTYEGNEHVKAAQALAEKLGWIGTWHEGGMPDGTGNVYILVNSCSAVFTIERKL